MAGNSAKVSLKISSGVMLENVKTESTTMSTGLAAFLASTTIPSTLWYRTLVLNM